MTDLNREMILAAEMALMGCRWVTKGREQEVAKFVVNGMVELMLGDDYTIDLVENPSQINYEGANYFQEPGTVYPFGRQP